MRAILTYHSIDESGSVISLSRSTFVRHIRWLTSGRVRVVSIDTLLRLPVDAEAVAITFDDGFENFRDVAAPLLLEHGLPVTVFVVTGRTGRNNNWMESYQNGIPTLPLLDWASLRKLVAMGVTLGSHSCTHRDLTQLTEDDLTHEVETSAAQLLLETGIKPRHFAYPYGSVNPDVIHRAASAYGYGCTTDFRAFDEVEDPQCLPRLDTYYFRDAARLDAWGSRRFRTHLQVRAKLRGLRAALVETHR